MNPDLQIGSRGAEVGNWQRFLVEQGVRDGDGRTLVIDEAFGIRSFSATRRWQALEALPITGVVGRQDRVVARQSGFVPFIQAMNYTAIHPKKRVIDVIVIHTMENQEKPDSAENVALWFAGKTSYLPPMASAHYGIDLDSVVQMVRDVDVAWHTPGANHNGIGLEHAGYARQNPNDWDDPASQAILDLSARLSARLAQRYGIPLTKLAPDELRAGVRGFCGHMDATIAFPGKGRTHMDPGVHFPWQAYLEKVAKIVRGF